MTAFGLPLVPGGVDHAVRRVGVQRRVERRVRALRGVQDLAGFAHHQRRFERSQPAPPARRQGRSGRAAPPPRPASRGRAAATACSIEGSANSATRSPGPTPRPASRRAAATASRSSSANVIVRSPAIRAGWRGTPSAARDSQSSSLKPDSGRSVGRLYRCDPRWASPGLRTAATPTYATRPARTMRRGSQRSPSTGLRFATHFARRRCSSCSDAFERARDDPAIGVIVLTGRGTGRILLRRRPESTGRRRLHRRRRASRSAGSTSLDLQVQIRRLPKPIVAMVAGYAVGGGHVLHVVCDLTIAADNARFGQTGPKVGSFDGGYRHGATSRACRPEEGQGDLVPVPPVLRRGGARDGARQHGRPARAAGGGDRRLVPRDAAALAIRACGC